MLTLSTESQYHQVATDLGHPTDCCKGGAQMKSSIQFGTLFVAFLLSVILSPGPLAQPLASSAATGQANVTAGDGMLRSVSFRAVTDQDGSVSGQIEFQDPAPIPDQDVDGTGDPALDASPSGVRLYAEVNCLAVDGNRAIVGGQVTGSDPARYVGKQVLLFVEDSEKSRGRFSWGFYEPRDGAFCGSFPWAAYTPVGIAGGILQVHRE